MKKSLYMVCGFIFLGLGIIGIFLPVLPTTPFLLLTSFCFLRSSEKLHGWLLNHKVFGPPVKNYIEHRALRAKTKAVAVATLWLSLGISIVLVPNIYVDIVLVAVGVFVSIYLLSLKTLRQD